AERSTVTGPLRTPRRAAFRATWAVRALAIMVLVGVQPLLIQVPPSCAASAISTRLPAAASRAASGTPACPLPITMMSRSIGAPVVRIPFVKGAYTTFSTEALAELSREVRERSFELIADLGDAQLLGPRLAIVNPLLWEIGHVAWFQEHWVLREGL